MSKMDVFLNSGLQERVLMFASAELEIAKQRAELADLRARVAELEKPKTCSGCAYFHNGVLSNYCEHKETTGLEIFYPNILCCIHHAPHPAP